MTVLLWFAALGTGLMAGVYFTFSGFVMASLARLPDDRAAAAVNTINDVILRSPFMPLFIGTTLAAAVIAILALSRWNEPGSAILAGGGAIYVVGMFGVTATFNVPLNNRLITEAATLWPAYLDTWTNWNHVRTFASLLAAAAFTYGIAVR
ncbi:DUF1772 domain-containing protein [Pseudohoeflea suaedae]